MKPIVVEFNYDPDMPLESRHKGEREKCLVLGRKEFKDFDSARNFLMSCSYPVTTIEELNELEWELEWKLSWEKEFKALKKEVRKLERMMREAEYYRYEELDW